MSKLHQCTYHNQTIDFYLERRARKTLEISVDPNLIVKVVAPLNTLMKDILENVKKRARWIIKQIDFFKQFLPKRSERYYLSGETHLYLGRKHRLKVKKAISKSVDITGSILTVNSHTPSRPEITRHILETWYFEQAKQVLAERVQACIKKFPDKHKFTPSKIIVRQLLTRWGSMTKSGTLVLNRDLIKVPQTCIDYVITHELCHLKFKDHSKSFYNFLDQTMPDWEKHKAKLEQML